MSAPRLLVIEHEANCPPGYVGGWLDDEGVDQVVCRPYKGDPVPTDLDGYDGLLVLGGEMSAYDDAAYPWLTDAKALVRAAVDAETPTLGICLGHQLMTVALGGQVRPNPAGKAMGVIPVGWHGAAAHDPLVGMMPADALAVHWNDDVATELPAAARVLATTDDGAPQVVRFAPRAWGVQLHPEVGADIVGTWRSPSQQADAALADIRAHEPVLQRTWQPMVKAFAAQLS